jgi:hypothetical protein
MDIAQILTKRYPDALWTLDGDSYSGLTWLSDGEAPTLAELEAEWAQVEYEVAYEAVQKARQAAYQSESDPIFFDFQRGEVTEQDWLDAVHAVKDAHPYPVDPSTIVVEPEPVDEPVVDDEVSEPVEEV